MSYPREITMRKLIFSVLVIAVSSCGLFPGGPYRGRVIDDETKKPLVGAVVLVYWNLESFGMGHGPTEQFLDAEEVLTDGRGEFVVGKSPPKSWNPLAWVSDPYILIFQPGYGYFPHYQKSPPWPQGGYKRLLEVMERETVVITLPRLKTRAQRFLVSSRVVPTGSVPDQKMPNLLRLLKIEQNQLGYRTHEDSEKIKKLIREGHGM